MIIIKSIFVAILSGILFGFSVYIVSALLLGSDENGNYYAAVIYAFIAMPIGILGSLVFLVIKHFRK